MTLRLWLLWLFRNVRFSRAVVLGGIIGVHSRSLPACRVLTPHSRSGLPGRGADQWRSCPARRQHNHRGDRHRPDCSGPAVCPAIATQEERRCAHEARWLQGCRRRAAGGTDDHRPRRSRSAAIGAGTYRHRFDSGRKTNEDRRGPKACAGPPVADRCGVRSALADDPLPTSHIRSAGSRRPSA